MRLVLLHAKKLPSAVLGRVEFLFAILLKVLLPRDLGEELGKNCIIAQNTPARCLVEFREF